MSPSRAPVSSTVVPCCSICKAWVERSVCILIICRTFTAVDENLTWSECIGCHYCNENTRRICCDMFGARCVPAKRLFLILFAASFLFHFTYKVQLSVSLYFWLACQLRNLVVVFIRERGAVSERVWPRWCFDVACDTSHDYRKSDCPINLPVYLTNSLTAWVTIWLSD